MSTLALRLLTAALTFALGVGAALLFSPRGDLPVPAPVYPSGAPFVSSPPPGYASPRAEMCALHGVTMRSEWRPIPYARRFFDHRWDQTAGKAENFPNCHVVAMDIVARADSPPDTRPRSLVLSCPACAAAEKVWRKLGRK